MTVNNLEFVEIGLIVAEITKAVLGLRRVKNNKKNLSFYCSFVTFTFVTFLL